MNHREMTDTLAFFVPGPPVPFTRVLRGERSKRAERYRAYRQVVALTAKAAGAEPIEGPIKLSIAVFLGRLEKRRADMDNFFKAIGDALNTVAYFDDLQVVKGDFGVFPAGGSVPEGVSVIVERVLCGEETA